MEMANCRKCKKLFAKIRSQICTDCEREEEELFLVVQDYLRDHPKATIGEVSEATGATAKKILGYLRDGRIETVTGELNCRDCGEKISTGHFCATCAEKASREMDNMIASMKSAMTPSAQPENKAGKVVTMHTRKK